MIIHFYKIRIGLKKRIWFCRIQLVKSQIRSYLFITFERVTGDKWFAGFEVWNVYQQGNLWTSFGSEWRTFSFSRIATLPNVFVPETVTQKNQIMYLEIWILGKFKQLKSIWKMIQAMIKISDKVFNIQILNHTNTGH